MAAQIAVIEKAFVALEAMNKLARPASLKELAAITDLPKPTLFRILQTLVELGYVDQDSARSRYGLSLRLFHLGRGDSFEDVRQRAMPFMEPLHRRFNETINLGVLEGGSVFYVHFIETTRNLRWQVRPGTQDPFYCTSLGRAMVAHLPKARQKQLIERIKFEERTPHTPRDAVTVRRLLAETAANGWACDAEENDIGVSCFGVPLMLDGEPTAAISLSIPESRLTPELREEIISALLAVREGRIDGDYGGG
ncbi:IclR family transcriptional regulator [Pelagibacterium montanilacus]|uniref:IclR family transcriptional regulator n=1 Tax=Pelagibacterium montanilacus TaxID=2185280 RepID=UPI000F8D0295|nr:IclR family transcriptional regulator [Pelagibacterium montanilacus]